jgi:hypothetical protein
MNLNDTTSTAPISSEATALVNKMRRQYPDLVILPAHDPGAAGRLAQATAPATHPHATQDSQ